METNKPTSNDSEFNFDAALEELTNMDISLDDEPNRLDTSLDIDITETSDINSTFDASVLDVIVTTAPSVTDTINSNNSANSVNDFMVTEDDYNVEYQNNTFESEISLDGDFSQDVPQTPQDISNFDNTMNNSFDNVHDTADSSIDEASMITDGFAYDVDESSVPTNDFNTESPDNTSMIDSSDLDNETSDDNLAIAPLPLAIKKTDNTTKLLKVLAAVIGFVILGLLAFLFLGSSDSTPEEKAVVPAKNSPVNPEKKAPEVKLIQEVNKPATPKIVNAEVPEKTKSESSDKTETTQSSIEANKTTEAKDKLAEKPVTKPVIEAVEVKTADPKAILNAAIPKEEVLVKEEIDKLNDQEERMVEQKNLLDKRVEMMDELTSKKQEQIELLEKQIAQLEATQKDVN